jgi:pilus assembly protein CpaB
MQRRLLFVLITAVLIASGASYMVYRVAGAPRTVSKPIPATEVVVAARDLDIGTLVRETDLKMVAWPGSVPKGSILKKATLLNRGVVSSIYQGEPVTENRLAADGSGGGLAATIPAGMRACAVRVNEVVGVAGFVIPGMRVDVLITGLPPGQSAEAGPAVKTLLQNIQVLSAGANIGKDKEGKPQQVQVVNLLVNPHDAEVLSLAGNETHIQLVLRNPMDTVLTVQSGSYMSELFGAPKRAAIPSARASVATVRSPIPAPAIPTPRADPPAVIEVLNGSTHTLVRFQNPGGGQ